MFLQAATLWCVCIWFVKGAVLDPSMYLLPTPPLTDTSESMPPEILWSRSANPILDPRRKPPAQVEEITGQTPAKGVEQVSTTAKNLAPRPKLFWPSSLRASQYSASVGTGSIQVPLTFSLSGLYGRYAPEAGTGIIASSYGTVSEVGGKAVAALAGTGYGRYGSQLSQPGLRIYRGENGPAWSGWGNGKWGHYGKG